MVARERERGSRGRDRRKPDEDPSSESLIEKVVHINRVAKVVKGGRNFSFNAVVVVGDGHGRVGFGLGKANEVTDAITKGTEAAKRSMKRYPLVGTTLPHTSQGKFCAGRVVIKPASPGTGVIAGGTVRAVMECLGVRDVLTKILGTNNPHNVVKATLTALDNMMDVRMTAEKRGISVREVFEA